MSTIEDQLFRIGKNTRHFLIICEDCKKSIWITGLNNSQEGLNYWGIPKIPPKLKKFLLEHEDHNIKMEATNISIENYMEKHCIEHY